MKIKFIIFVIVLVLAVSAFGLYSGAKPGKAGELDGFAKCIKSSGAQFYGTFWCSHCQSQKKLFGTSKEYLPYIECSNPEQTEQLPICTEKGIEGYPTWIFASGKRLSGELSLKVLSEETQCLISAETAQ